MSNLPIRVFVGSGEASLLERKTLIYSLHKHTKRELDIYVFNGTHNAIERNNEPPVLAPMSLRVKYRNYTEFSSYRFLIPQICNNKDRAIFIDSDIIGLADIGELFDMPMDGNDILAVKGNYGESDRWAMSVALFNCETCKFDLEQIFDQIDEGLFQLSDLAGLTPTFLAHHPHKIGKLNPVWNTFDKYDRKTKLIHYTNLDQQPWKYHDHPYGELWHQYFQEAIKAGFITQDDISKSLSRAYVRRDILKGNYSLGGLGRVKAAVSGPTSSAKRVVKSLVRRG